MNHPTRQRLQLGTIAVLLLVIAAMAYKFVVVGSVEPAPNGRTAIVLAEGERDFVLREMRGFVAGLQQLTAALAHDDMKAAAEAARGMGMHAAHGAPVAMVAKLPLEFKTLGFGVHREFDTIAADAPLGRQELRFFDAAGAERGTAQGGAARFGCVDCDGRAQELEGAGSCPGDAAGAGSGERRDCG